MSKTIVLGKTTDGRDLRLDVERLVESRMLLQANSGGGKSWALRRILEQTHGMLQQLVLDVEGEFHTLRERFDYVLVARTGGDTLADPRSAGLLARRLLELGVSAIVDLYELHAHERIRFVRLFLEALVDAPKDLWHPCLVVVDEAHVFCPEAGHAESAGAVIDLATRGRKRGFCCLLATQRLSKLHKDAAAECNVKLIGRASLDVDMKRAGAELGFTGREDLARLRALERGHFFAFGPGLSDQVLEVHVGEVETTHPKAGQRATQVPPAREKVRRVLEQLADLPKEAEQEARTAAELRAQVTTLKRQLSAKPLPPAPSAPRVEVVERAVLKDGHLKRLEAVTGRWAKGNDALAEVGREIAAALRNGHGHAVASAARATAALQRPAPAPRPPPAAPRAPAGPPADGLSGPEQRILDAAAWLEGTTGAADHEETAVAFLAGYTVGGGAFNNPRGALRTKGLITYPGGGRIGLTEEGRALARPPEAAATPADVQARVRERLPGPERKLLDVLIAVYPEALTNEDLAERAGYQVGGGAFNNPRGRLRTLGLVTYPDRGMVQAAPVLFLEGARP